MGKFLGFVVVCLALGSCGSSGGSGGGTCQQIGAAICTKACACRDGAMCAVSQGGLSLTFDSEADCKGIFVSLACSMGDKAAYNDAAACLTLVNAAMCTGTGADGALSYPPDTACESPSDTAP